MFEECIAVMEHEAGLAPDLSMVMAKRHCDFLLHHWQCPSCIAAGQGLALPSVVKAPNEHWATELCRVCAGRDGLVSVALVIDCHARELLGWHLSRSGRSKTAESALEQALIARHACLGNPWHVESCETYHVNNDPGDLKPHVRCLYVGTKTDRTFVSSISNSAPVTLR